MFKFVSWSQIVMWRNSLGPVGPMSVLKQIEHRLVLVIEILPSGRHTTKYPAMEVK